MAFIPLGFAVPRGTHLKVVFVMKNNNLTYKDTHGKTKEGYGANRSQYH